MARLKAANNAKTKLVKSMDDSNTILFFEVEDASVLPEPPFRATIDNGKESMEIIEVVGKDGNLLGAQRGVEGTTLSSHDAGAVIENNFTAGTYQALVDAINDLREKIIYIEDEGDNEHGRYVRYSDGKQECYMEVEVDARRHEHKITYPKSFIEQPTAFMSFGAANLNTIDSISRSYLNTTGGLAPEQYLRHAYLYFDKPNADAFDDLKVHVVAIGRWK